MLISRTWTLLHCTSYIVNIGLNFKNIYEDWKALRQDLHSTTKTFILFDMIMNCIDIGAIGYTLHNKRSENTYTFHHPIIKNQLDTELYEQGMQLLERASHTWHQSKPPLTAPPLSLQKAQEVFKKLHTIVQAYRQINFQFEIAQGISLLTRLVRHVMKNGFLARMDLLVQLILEKATTILSFHSKAHCNIDLQPCSNELLSPLRKVSNIASFLIGISMVRELILGPIPIRVEGFLLTPFTLPQNLASGAGYPKIPVQYHHQAPFNQHLCDKTRLPITKALFIWKKQKLYRFEKEALLTDIFASKSAARPWVIPGTEITFVENEIYEDQSLDARIANDLATLRESSAP